MEKNVFFFSYRHRAGSATSVSARIRARARRSHTHEELINIKYQSARSTATKTNIEEKNLELPTLGRGGKSQFTVFRGRFLQTPRKKRVKRFKWKSIRDGDDGHARVSEKEKGLK